MVLFSSLIIDHLDTNSPRLTYCNLQVKKKKEKKLWLPSHAHSDNSSLINLTQSLSKNENSMCCFTVHVMIDVHVILWFERRGTRSNVYVFLFHGVIFKIKTLVFKAKGIKFRSRFWQCMKIYNKINFHQTCMMTLLLRTVEWSWFPLHLSPKQLAP